MSATLDKIVTELAVSRLHQTLGITATKLVDNQVTLTLPLNADTERLPNSNQFHGGAIATFADVSGDAAVIAMTGSGVPTVNMRVDFLRPAPGPMLRAEAVCRRLGRTIAVADVDIFDGADRLVAVARGTYMSALV
jgi:uncharacterized protein (TIGR00369 family)